MIIQNDSSREFEKMLAKQKNRPQIPAKPAGLRKPRPNSCINEWNRDTHVNSLEPVRKQLW